MNQHGMAQSNLAAPDVVITPAEGLFHIPLREIWTYRELLYFLVWRDLKVRYKQSLLGVLWIVLQPLITMLIYTLLFHRLLGVQSSGGIPYAVFAYAALLPWMYFSQSLARVSTLLVQDKNLLTKVYFPRLIMPLAGVLPGLVDFLIGFAILLVMMLFYRISPGAGLALLPLALLLALVTALGAGMWLSALYVQYRDVQHIVPFLLQIWMYLTPIIYPITSIPEAWRWLYSLNPMVGVVQMFRAALFNDSGALLWNPLSLLVALVLLLSGAWYFRRMERIFADVV